jgi:murein DD-endopeptidase MepM/ murein hydrolase activator NlpD
VRPLLGFVLIAGLAAAVVGVLWPDAWFLVQLSFEAPPRELAVPVDGIAPSQLRDSWGNPRTGGRRHEGIDIFARRGTLVRSTTRGIVWRVGEDRLGGNVVFVLGPGRQLHYYAHLDHAADVHIGQRVEVGSPLGYVGNTGNARGGPAHLHYGVYAPLGTANAAPSGAIDPYPMLKGNIDRGTSPDSKARTSAAARRENNVQDQNSSLSPGFMLWTLVDVLPSALMYSSGVPTRNGLVP